MVVGNFLNQKTFASNLPQNFWISKLPGNLVLLKFLPKFSIFSNIFIKNFCKYALSNGTFCQILDIFYDYNLVKIVLPSKHTKLISGWSFVLMGRNAKQDYRFNVLSKAGVDFYLVKNQKYGE